MSELYLLLGRLLAAEVTIIGGIALVWLALEWGAEWAQDLARPWVERIIRKHRVGQARRARRRKEEWTSHETDFVQH